MSKRKILVVGAGAIGGIYAAYASKLADVTGLPIEKTFDYIQWLHDLRK